MTAGVEHSPVRDWARWREERTATLSAPHGWLSLTGLHWLDATPRAVAGVPGRWSADGSVVRVADADRLVVDGTAVAGSASVTVAEGESVLWAAFGETRVEALARGGRAGIRVRDPHAPALAGFTGVPVFDYAPDLVVTAVFEPFAEPRRVMVGSAQEGLTSPVEVLGELRFTLGGESRSLVAARAGDDLSVVFHDPTNGTESAAWRSVTVPAPDEHGATTVDFNRATNFPSAFTPYGTCPRPPEGNTLTVPVRAGERAIG